VNKVKSKVGKTENHWGEMGEQTGVKVEAVHNKWEKHVPFRKGKKREKNQIKGFQTA